MRVYLFKPFPEYLLAFCETRVKKRKKNSSTRGVVGCLPQTNFVLLFSSSFLSYEPFPIWVFLCPCLFRQISSILVLSDHFFGGAVLKQCAEAQCRGRVQQQRAMVARNLLRDFSVFQKILSWFSELFLGTFYGRVSFNSKKWTFFCTFFGHLSFLHFF